MCNHLVIGDFNQRKILSRKISKFNVSHVVCERSFTIIYLLFSNLNLYRQRISFFCPTVCLSTGIFFFSFLFSTNCIFSLLFFLSVVVIDVVLYFFFFLTLTFTHAHTMSRLFVELFFIVVVICGCYHQHNYRLCCLFFFFLRFFSIGFFSFGMCVT